MSEMPVEWLEVTTKIEKIGEELRSVVKDEKERTFQQYAEWLDILTGCYMYLKPLFNKYSAAKRNNEDAKYMDIKNNWKSDPDNPKDKFVSATADREASVAVAKLRYIRDWVEGWVLAAECGIFTLRKHLSENNKEVRLEE